LLFGGDGVGDNGWYVGIVGGIGRTSLTIPDRSSSTVSDNVHVGIYATGTANGVVFRLGAAYTQHAVTVTRMPAFQGFAETLTAKYQAGTGQLFGEIGYPIAVGDMTIEPFAGLAGILQNTGDYTETGGVSALTAPSSTYGAVIATLGIRASETFVLNNGMKVEAYGSVAWKQAIGATPTQTQAFAGGAPFTVAAAPLSGGALNLEIGAGIELTENARLDLTYSGLFSSNTSSHAAKATLHISF
jgi:outer membrane autotransporter protein